MRTAWDGSIPVSLRVHRSPRSIVVAIREFSRGQFAGPGPFDPGASTTRTMLRAGIVGLPNVGKSTLFNAVTRTRKAEAANYPFCTIDPNAGMVTVPDARL